MKKILAIGLMLCIFTAMVVGTAAATPSKVCPPKVCITSVKYDQGVTGAAKCITVDQKQIGGIVTVDKINVGCIKVRDAKIVGTAQSQCVKVDCGFVCVGQSSEICVVS